MKQDLFQAPDYYNLDELLTEEHKLIRNSARDWVKKSVSPIIEEYAQKAKFHDQLIKGLADIGAFGPYIPEEYGGVGLGKTHLTHAIGNHLKNLRPDAKIKYLHAERYVHDVVKAYENKAFDSFKKIYHSLDLLLIDDIQFIGKKTEPKKNFFTHLTPL
jgi:predicted ATPase